LVLAYCGYFLWNWATIPFIQVTWDGTDEPIRQTTSLAGAADDDELLLLEPHPAAAPASRAAAPNAAADLVSFTRDLLPGLILGTSRNSSWSQGAPAPSAV
jgi:hypothetical protein